MRINSIIKKNGLLLINYKQFYLAATTTTPTSSIIITTTSTAPTDKISGNHSLMMTKRRRRRKKEEEEERGKTIKQSQKTYFPIGKEERREREKERGGEGREGEGEKGGGERRGERRGEGGGKGNVVPLVVPHMLQKYFCLALRRILPLSDEDILLCVSYLGEDDLQKKICPHCDDLCSQCGQVIDSISSHIEPSLRNTWPCNSVGKCMSVKDCGCKDDDYDDDDKHTVISTRHDDDKEPRCDYFPEHACLCCTKLFCANCYWNHYNYCGSRGLSCNVCGEMIRRSCYPKLCCVSGCKYIACGRCEEKSLHTEWHQYNFSSCPHCGRSIVSDLRPMRCTTCNNWMCRQCVLLGLHDRRCHKSSFSSETPSYLEVCFFGYNVKNTPWGTNLSQRDSVITFIMSQAKTRGHKQRPLQLLIKVNNQIFFPRLVPLFSP